LKKLLILAIIFLSKFSVNSQTGIEIFSNKLASQYLGNRPGALVIGVYNNGVQQIFYYGETELHNGKKPDSTSVFELGSLTETFTSLLYADQVIKGKINEDDKLSNFLPVDVPAPVYQHVICEPYKTETGLYDNGSGDNMQLKFTPYICKPDTSTEPQPILLCYLSTHTSGLPDKPFNFHKKEKSNPYADYSTEDMYEFLRGYSMIQPIGFEYKHSEIGVAVLGKALSLKSGKDFETLLIENLLDRMQMNDTRIKLSEEMNKKFLSGYTQKGNPAPRWTGDVYAPVIGLHSTPGDMMKFLSLNISLNKSSVTNLLDYTHNPRIKSGKLAEPGIEVGLGWRINPATEQYSSVVWQSGLTGGFASYIGFNEAEHVGVFVLSSVSEDVNDIGLKILHSFKVE